MNLIRLAKFIKNNAEKEDKNRAGKAVFTTDRF